MLLQSYNPATQALLAELPVTTKEQLNNMVQKAHDTKALWSGKSFEERAKLLSKAYDLLMAQCEEMAALIHEEMGKPLKEALGEAKGFVGSLPYLIEEMGPALAPTQSEDKRTRTVTYYDPLGVCACIAPWNFPLGMPHSLVAPALLAGNTVLLKPSEEVTLVGKRYVEILNEVLPEGVLQLVIGAGEQGRQLVQSDVQLITFTGSQATGKHILSEAGKDLKRVILELGGKDPLIILDDADLNAAAKFAANNSFRNAGQVCVSTEKIYIPEANEEDFISKLRAEAESFEVGAMINQRQKSHVVQQVKDAIKDGAVLEYGDPNQGDGNFLKPIILRNVRSDMNIMVDETFGPVACVCAVDDEQKAVEMANEGDFGLGAVVFGQDLDRARRIARQLKAGMVGINKGVGGASGSPWVGARGSGYGFHGSKAGHRQFTQIRIVSEPV